MAQMTQERPTAEAGAEEGLELTRERVEAFLENRREKGCKSATLNKYRHDLTQLWRFLPEEKRIGRGTLAEWRRQMGEEGFNVRTLNARISAANSFLDFMGRRELQLSGLPRLEEDSQPELSRAEYIRLLQTARALEDEWSYLLVKVFALMGIPVQELAGLTVEAARAGRMVLAREGEDRWVRVPGILQAELLGYARRQGRTSGPLFLTRNGRSPGRSRISASMRALCRTAQVPLEKGNPRCLRRFYHSAMEQVEADIRRLAEQAYDRMLEAEQLAIGWEAADRSLPPRT